MNISPVSSVNKRSQDFDMLQSTLQSGNLAAAQGAFAAFQQDVQKIAQTAGRSSLFAPGSQASQDLQKLGNALKSSNIAGAQQAFATLKQDLQATVPGNNLSAANPAHRRFSHSDVANGSQLTAAAPALVQSASSILNVKA